MYERRTTIDVPPSATLNERIKALFPPCAIFHCEPERLNTLSERRMRQMSRTVRAKPDWIKMLDDADMRAAWAAEARAQELTDAEFAYVLDELAYYASLHLPDCSAKLSTADDVWYSDTLIDAETTNELKRRVAILEDVPDRQKDWYPEGQSRVLNLIDPSLYPLIYKSSRLCRQSSTSPLAALTLEAVREFPGSFNEWRLALNGTSESEPSYHFPIRNCCDNCESRDFGWLPSEFRVDDNGAVTIESYINNLHPIKHKALYLIIASVFSKFLPLLEQVVTDVVHPRQPRVKPDASKYYTSNIPMPAQHGDDYDQWKAQADFVPPQPEPFVVPVRPATPHSLRSRRLQVIVRMSHVELTPENSIYSDKEWKLAGLANERIIATCVFFYDVANVAPSSLRFREAISSWDYEADSHDVDSMTKAYGLDETMVHDEYFLSQEVGNIDIKDGQCLVFPGVYQYQMPELKLEDSTKPGHCKMLTLYLVDPSTRIPSTEIVPPQQKDWWKEDVRCSEPFCNLPLLITDRIVKRVDYPISLEDAKKLRRDCAEQYRWVVSDISYNDFEPCFDYAGTLY
ncbi:hypothetical protein GGH91_000281 [Coemansia sp. RSA 2671]|nr:hypothetical protein GGH91_000281 [Coemansia sp. RSA 2671]